MAMDHPILSPSIPRIIPPTRTHSRNPSRSPTRRQFADDLLSDLSPATTLEAFTNPSGKLKASVEAASPFERAFGLRATFASKKIQEWVRELQQWPWPSQGGSVGFEMPTPKRRKLSNSSVDVTDDESGELEYFGSLLASEVARYEDRLDEIEDDMEDLHVEEIKRQVLDTHFSPRSRPSSSASNAPPIPNLLATYVRMDDFTAIVTATVLQSLPNLSRLMRLIDVWTIRLRVLRKVPPLIKGLEDAENALQSSWDASGMVGQHDPAQGTLSQGTFDTMRAALQDKVTTLGRDLDYLLDTLEGRQDTLPESWLDRMETIEQSYGEWVVSGERKVKEEEWAKAAEILRLKEEALRVAREAEEAEKARRKEEEERIALLQAEQERLDTEVARQQAIFAEQKRQQEAEEAENARRKEEEERNALLQVEQERLVAEMAKEQAAIAEEIRRQEAEEAENKRRKEEEEHRALQAEQERLEVELAKQQAAMAEELRLQEVEAHEKAFEEERNALLQAEQERLEAELAKQQAAMAEKIRLQEAEAQEKAFEEERSALLQAEQKRLDAEMAREQAFLEEQIRLQQEEATERALQEEKAALAAVEIQALAIASGPMSQIGETTTEATPLARESSKEETDPIIEAEEVRHESPKTIVDAQLPLVVFAEDTLELQQHEYPSVTVRQASVDRESKINDSQLQETQTEDPAQLSSLDLTSEGPLVLPEEERACQPLSVEIQGQTSEELKISPFKHSDDLSSEEQVLNTLNDGSSERCKFPAQEPVDEAREFIEQANSHSESTSSDSSILVDTAESSLVSSGIETKATSLPTSDFEDAYRPPPLSRFAPFDGAGSEFSEPAINDFEESSFHEEDLHEILEAHKPSSEPILSSLMTTINGEADPPSPSSESSTSRTFKSPVTDSDGIGSSPTHNITQFSRVVSPEVISSPIVLAENHPDLSGNSSRQQSVDGDTYEKYSEEVIVELPTHQSFLENVSNAQEQEPLLEAVGDEDTVTVASTTIVHPKLEESDRVEPVTTQTSETTLTTNPVEYREDRPLSRDIAILSIAAEALETQDESNTPSLSTPERSEISILESFDTLTSDTLKTPPKPALQDSPIISEHRFSISTMSPVAEEDRTEMWINSGDGANESMVRSPSPVAGEIEMRELETFMFATSISSDTTATLTTRRESISSDTSTIIDRPMERSLSPVLASPFSPVPSSFPDVDEQSPTAGRTGLRAQRFDDSPIGLPSFAIPRQGSSLSEARDLFPRDSTPSPTSPIKFSLSEAPEAISPPRPQSPKKPNSDEQMQQQISNLLESIPARFRLTSAFNTSPFAAETLRPLRTRHSAKTLRSVRSNSSMSSYGSRAPTPSFTLAPAFSKTTQRSRPPSANPEIKVYHLSQSTGEAPIKLFVRLVGENGERVMVRVGGGWADLGEYLKEYASHHGRRATGETADKVEIQDLPSRAPSRISSNNSVLSSTSTLRGNPGSSPASRPVSGMEARPRSSLLIRKTRKSMGEATETTYSRLGDYRTPSTPLPAINRAAYNTPPSATSLSSSPGGTGASGRSSRLSWTEEDSSLGLAGPKGRKVTISEKDQEWVESMKEKVRLASAEKERREKERESGATSRTTSFGEMDRIGMTKRLFRKSQVFRPEARRESEGGRSSVAGRRESEGGNGGVNGNVNRGRF